MLSPVMHTLPYPVWMLTSCWQERVYQFLSFPTYIPCIDKLSVDFLASLYSRSGKIRFGLQVIC